MAKQKIIIDLCGGTGSWSKPYKDAGYKVINITLPEWDVRDWQGASDQWHPIRELIRNGKIYGILAAPPCTQFSLARTTAKTPRDLRAGMSIVGACLRIVWEARQFNKLAFWAMENPKGLLRQFMGNPPYTFDASEFGEDYNKATDLWGYFKYPVKKKMYKRFDSTDKNTRKLPVLPASYERDPNMTLVAMKRSITPAGFAKAFYEANK